MVIYHEGEAPAFVRVIQPDAESVELDPTEMECGTVTTLRGSRHLVCDLGGADRIWVIKRTTVGGAILLDRLVATGLLFSSAHNGRHVAPAADEHQ